MWQGEQYPGQSNLQCIVYVRERRGGRERRKERRGGMLGGREGEGAEKERGEKEASWPCNIIYSLFQVTMLASKSSSRS